MGWADPMLDMMLFGSDLLRYAGGTPDNLSRLSRYQRLPVYDHVSGAWIFKWEHEGHVYFERMKLEETCDPKTRDAIAATIITFFEQAGHPLPISDFPPETPQKRIVSDS